MQKRSRTELEKRFSLVARKLQGNLDIRREKRPFFIWYTILLQLAVLTCTLFLYPIAPINFRPTLVTESVLAPSGQTVLMSKNVSGNIFIGRPAPRPGKKLLCNKCNCCLKQASACTAPPSSNRFLLKFHWRMSYTMTVDNCCSALGDMEAAAVPNPRLM